MCVKSLKTVKHYIIERNLHSIKKKIKKKKNVACFTTQDYFLKHLGTIHLKCNYQES